LAINVTTFNILKSTYITSNIQTQMFITVSVRCTDMMIFTKLRASAGLVKFTV